TSPRDLRSSLSRRDGRKQSELPQRYRRTPPCGRRARRITPSTDPPPFSARGHSLPTIEAANEEALRRLLAGEPVLVDVMPAAHAIPELPARRTLPAGPPIEWERMCGPLRGAIMGIAVFEGWANDLDDAARKAAAGAFAFHPNHHFGAVGPMTGMTT